MTKTSKKNYMHLETIPCIYYPFCFWKDIIGIRALIDSDSEINVMTPVYAAKLGLKADCTDIGAHNIDGPTFKIFGIILVSFQVENKISKA